jgi:hypothetical protein
LGERDKVEPFWARPARVTQRLQRLVVPERREKAREPGAETPPPVPGEAPREPSFPVSRAERRETIAALIGAPAAGDAARQEPSLGRAPPEPPAEPDAQGWIQLPLADAARHRLFGVKGWLVVLAVFVALGLLMGLVELVDFWATTDHGGLAAWIMAVLRSVMVLWVALVLGLLLGRSRAFPTNFVAYTMVNVIYLGLFGLAFAHVTHGAVFAGVAAAIALNLLAIAYVLRSRRVNVTYRHRVRARKRPAAPPPAAPATSPA